MFSQPPIELILQAMSLTHNADYRNSDRFPEYL
jgi:hypothetical protein